jgi:hypothetical protein
MKSGCMHFTIRNACVTGIILYIKATCVSVRPSVATKTRRDPETSEVLKTFEDLNRGVCLSITTNSAGQGQGRAGQDRAGAGQDRAGQGRRAQNLSLFFFVLTKTTFFSF